MSNNRFVLLISILLTLTTLMLNNGCNPTGGGASVILMAYVANWNSANISALKIDTSTGALTHEADYPVNTNPFGIAAVPSGKYLYVTNHASNNISGFRIYATTGTLEALESSPFPAGTGPYGIAIAPSGKFLYVANKEGNTISTYVVSSETGSLEGTGTMTCDGDIYQNLPDLAVDLSGAYLYATSYGLTDEVLAFEIDPVHGTLEAVSGSPFSANNHPWAIEADPKKEAFYVANQGDGSVSSYKIYTMTGTIEEAGSPTLTGNNIQWLAVEPQARYLYVTAMTDNKVCPIKINSSTGTLENPVLEADTGFQPQGASVATTGKFLCVTNTGDGTVSSYKIHASGALTSAGSAVGAGTNPANVTIVSITR